MLTLLDLPDSCTAEEAARLVTTLAGQLSIAEEPPSLRTLRLWRGKQLLSKGGRQFTRKNLLEVLCIMRLRAEGVTTGTAAEKCIALDEERLLLFLTAPQVMLGGTPSSFAWVTLQVLAKGILEQYRRVALGAIVGHSNDRRTGITGIENTPTSLRQASARLGRLYFEEGREDQVASLHTLLVLGTKPLREWAPQAVWTLPDAADAVLIDPDYRVPSEDCESIAQQAEGVSLDDLIENRIHSELSQTLAKLGDNADTAYTSIREFIGRHPLATHRELHGLYARPELPNAAVEFVRTLYIPVHADFAVQGLVCRCQSCRALVRRDGSCMLQGCREDHPQTQFAESLDLDDALIARPEILKYWIEPAREELRLYDALHSAGISVDLYPHSDRCDVAVGDDVGVDVKDYRDPAHLARKLNRGIGGLAFYRRCILAVADRRGRSGDYIARLREQLTPETRKRMEVRTVSDTIRELKRAYMKGRSETRARQA